MFLPLFFITSAALAAFEPCKLSALELDLPLYVRISQTLAANGMTNTSVLYATAPDPMFENDAPIEFRFVPSILPVLTLVVTHREPIAVSDGPVTIAAISDEFVVDLHGDVKGGQSCEVRLEMANQALEEMHQAYGF